MSAAHVYSKPGRYTVAARVIDIFGNNTMTLMAGERGLTACTGHFSRDHPMPTICMFYGIVIEMFWQDHAPPHFYALYGEHEALIDLQELRVLRGLFTASRYGAGAGKGSGSPRRTHRGLELMSSAANSEGDQACEVVPAIRHVVPWRVVTVEALPDWCLRVEFVDGTPGAVDLNDFLALPRVAGTAFEPLRESAFFAQAVVVMGAVQWPNGADLARDAMYDAIREHGAWVLE